MRKSMRSLLISFCHSFYLTVQKYKKIFIKQDFCIVFIQKDIVF